MPALDDILTRLEPGQSLLDYRKKLISSRGGTICDGKLPEAVTCTTIPVNGTRKISKIFLTRTSGNSKRQIPGFVFNADATSSIISKVSNNSPLRLFEDFYDKLLFDSPEKAELWEQTAVSLKKNKIKENIQRLVKETDLQYRSHGDRLHYLVVGKIITEAEKTGGIEKLSYPLLCFKCEDISINSLSAEISDTGFVNFVVDDRMFDKEITGTVGSMEVEMDSHNLPLLIDRLKNKLEKMNVAGIDKITVDTGYSMLGIVTGFETEYLDRAWEKLL